MTVAVVGAGPRVIEVKFQTGPAASTAQHSNAVAPVAIVQRILKEEP